MNAVKFYRDGTSVRVITIDTDTLTDTLEPAVYTLNRDIFGGYFLTFKSKKFVVPSKIYGSTVARAEKIIATYQSRDSSTGVLLTGDKGAGKTMLSSLVGNLMIDKGLPVILIEDPHCGAGFNEIITNIGECVLFFDEFGKIFKEKEKQDPQDKLLSIFDGTYNSKRLIMLTENSEGLINEFMKNRPGRIFYHFRYKKIEDSVIKEYSADLGVPEEIIELITLRADKSFQFSFDVLKAIVEEYKRYPSQDVEDICKDLNIEQPNTHEADMKVLEIIDVRTNTKLEPAFDSRTIKAVVGHRSQRVSWVSGKDEKGHNDYDDVHLSIKNIIKKEGKKTVFQNEHIVVICEEETPMTYRYTYAF